MNDLFSQLPEYDPHPDLWARIEADLDSDLTLARTVGDLPQYEPKAGLWAAIDNQLIQSEDMVAPVSIDAPTVIRPLWQQPASRPLWAGLAAAAVIVLVGAWLMSRSDPLEAVRIEYAVEQTTPLPAPDGVDASTADERAEEFIARQCAEEQLACQRPEVHELRNQLTDLTAQQKRITQERLTFGDDPTLLRAQVKIENQRAEVTKELITLLRL